MTRLIYADLSISAERQGAIKRGKRSARGGAAIGAAHALDAGGAARAGRVVRALRQAVGVDAAEALALAAVVVEHALRHGRVGVLDAGAVLADLAGHALGGVGLARGGA